MASSYDQFRDDSDLLIEEVDTEAPTEEDPVAEENDEPNWDKLIEYPHTRNEIQSFLSSRERRTLADDRFASAIDQLHDSIASSVEDLVNSVVELFATKSDLLDDYERNLNCDYVNNEKRRMDMQNKLEESARAAQGLFANLLMRIAQPADLGGGTLGEEGCGANSASDLGEVKADGIGDEEPDWDAITKHEPAKSEVPVYLEARSKREVAIVRFETAIEAFQQAVEECLNDLTQTMVDMYNDRSVKLDEYECMLKQDFVNNDEVRSKMKANIEDSANVASKMFEQLLGRVMQEENEESSFGQGQKHQFGSGALTQATTLGSP